MPSTDLESTIAGETAVAHLATAVGDRPHVAPVWYGYNDDVIRILTGGKKLENVKTNPYVGVSIQQDSGGRMDWMATIRGTATVTEDPDTVNQAARAVYTQYLGPDIDAWAPVHTAALSEDPNVALVEVSVGSATVRGDD